MAVLFNYPSSNYSSVLFNLGAGVTYRGASQSFTTVHPFTVSSFQLYMQKNGNPTGNVTSAIYTVTDGIRPAVLQYTGGNVAATSVGGTMSLQTFTTGNSTILPPGTYAIVVEYTGGDANNYVSVGTDSTSPTDPGNFSVKNTTSWLNGSAYDAIFTINGEYTPTVTTGTLGTPTINSVTLNGSTLANPGSLTITERGVAYGTSTSPTVSGGKVTSSGSPFDVSITGLSEDTTYYFRSYATYNGTTTYGSQVSVKTAARPVVTLNSPANGSTATILRPALDFTGNDGDNNNITYQLQINTTDEFSSPFIDTLSATDGGFSNLSTSKTDPFFSGNQIRYAAQEDLDRGQIYYWRVRGKDTTGTNTFGEWSASRSFTVQALVPTMTTNGASNITETTADVTGTISGDNGSEITERGVVYALTTDPTTANSKVIVSGTTSPYTANLTGLTEATTYYARAYAINGVGTAYGNTITFNTVTPESAPTVSTGIAGSVSEDSAVITGSNVTSAGTQALTERGVVFSSTETVPTTDDSKVTSSTATTGTFNSNLTGLLPETEYFVRAYAINSVGTSYGSVISFTTPIASTSETGDGYWTWSPGLSQATVGRTQSSLTYSSVNLPLIDLGLTDGLDYTFYFASVDAEQGAPFVTIDRYNGLTQVQDVITAGTAFTFTYDEAFSDWQIRLFVTGAAVEADEISAVFNDMYLAQESTFSGYVPFTPRGVTEVKIVNNQILDSRRGELIESIFNQVSGIEWYPFEVATEGLGYFEIGDRFTITDNEAQSRSVVVWNTKLTMDGGIKETLYTNKPDITETNYSRAGNSRLGGNIRNTQLQVDKQNGTIEGLVSNMYEFDGIVNTNYSQLLQEVDNITATVQQSYGTNLLRNSVMFAFDSEGNPDSWTLDESSTGSLLIQASNESLTNGAVSGNQFTLQDMTVTQRVTVRKDVDFIPEDDKQYYSISARVKKNTVGGAYIKLINRNETLTIDLPDQTSYFWDVVSLEGILPLDDYYDVEIYSDADADLQVTDLILAPGKTRKEWSQANGEVMNSSVSITTEGITVKSSQFQNNYTKIDSLGFEVHKQNANGARVFGFNDDETNVSKLKADEQISMAPLRVVPINYSTYKGWAFTISEDN